MHLQNALSAYLVAEFRHATGAYERSSEALPDCRNLADAPIADSLRSLTAHAKSYNTTLSSTRYSVGADRVLRHPAPPSPSTAGGDGPRVRRWPATQRDCLDYYATVTAALALPGGASETARAPGELGRVRSALLIGVEGDVKRVRALQTRFRNREQFLRERLRTDAPVQPGREQAGRFWNADLETGSGLAASVLEAAAEAHWLSLLVQHHRSGPVGHVMAQVAAGASANDDTLLERAIALNTFVFAIAQAMPWIFACDAAERARAQVRKRSVRDRVNPLQPLWIARRMILLALYRRAMVWRLLGDHRRSYNDYWKTQHIVRLTRSGLIGDGRRLELSVLDALAEYRVSELYRADHDYRQALVHSCRSHDRMQTLMDNASTETPAGRWIENSHWRVALLLSKGKAFYEQGQMKRACKWFLRAWEALDDVATTSGHRSLLNELAREELKRAADWLASVRHEPFVSKNAMAFELGATVRALDKESVPRELHALAADILDRLGHTLMVMRLPGDELARRCLELALELDRWNLLVRSDLLQLRSRDCGVTLPPDLPEPLRCWPSGGTVVDQVIRTAEHLTRERLDSASRPAAATDAKSVDQVVAHDLLDALLTHTDSMHVRAGLLYQHLAPSATSVKSQRPKVAMEFVCLRRYGSTSPFMARPAAVPAIGGGYLLRLLSRDSKFNILIDPGDGIVANLYRVGFAITDIDMIIVTHDHPDHMAGLDPILALRKEYVESPHRLTIYGNASVVERYSSVDLKTAVVYAMPAPEGEPLRVQARHAGVAQIRSLGTMHRDLGGNDALGFKLTLTDPREKPVGALTFMSDAAPEAIDGAEWAGAFEADVVVAHISNASVQELRALAFAGTSAHDDARAFADARIALRDSAAEHAQLAHAKLIHALDQSVPAENKHLLLQGLLSVARRFRDQRSARTGRVLVVGEFKEQLGPFRGKIAHHITGHVLDGAGHTALTADIGLRLRIASSGVSVLCSTCALNNDRLQSERYHAAGDIHEVCIKGNFEGMAWNCARHDPGTNDPTRFLERIAGYDVFGPAGLFHG